MSAQREAMARLIDQMLQYTSKLSPTDDPNSVLTNAFARALTQCGAFFKDIAFKEEDEWRLVTGVHLYDDEKFAFREGTSMPIPYYRMHIHNGSWDGNGKIDTIVVGPCPHPDAAKVSVIGLLMRYSVSSRTPGPHYWPEVQISAIPYRNW